VKLRSCAGVGVSLVLAASSPAFADDSPVDALSTAPDDATTVAARAEFRRGAALARSQQWNEAGLAFERSYRLKPHPVTSYNIAYCERAVGHPAKALSGFERALAEHRSGQRGVLTPDLIELAIRYRDEVAARVAVLRLAIPPGAGVAIDGQHLAAVAAAGPVVLDPGAHVLVVAKPGFVTAVLTRDFAAGQNARIEVHLESRPLLSHATTGTRTRVGLDRRWSYLAFGTGAASLVAAGVAGTLALRKRAQLEDKCDASHVCAQRYQGDIDSIGLYADTSTVAAILGAAGLGVGATLFFFGPERPRRE
jgi:hypothetical protein